jgi:hypothetical protein
MVPNCATTLWEILSRVSVTKTRVWIGESDYLIFTTRNCNLILHSQDYCNYSIRNVTHCLLILLLATLLFPWNFGTQVKSIPIPVFSHILSARTTHRKQSYCCVAQTTQKTSHVITISSVRWRADCYLAIHVTIYYQIRGITETGNFTLQSPPSSLTLWNEKLWIDITHYKKQHRYSDSSR